MAMKLNRLALLLPVVGALVLTPTGAFAKDKHHKHHHDDRHCHRENDRRYDDRRCDRDDDRRYDSRSYSERSYYGRSYDAPRYYTPNYYSPYRGSSDSHCAPRRSHFPRIVFGF
jgi:hypothetical protein